MVLHVVLQVPVEEGGDGIADIGAGVLPPVGHLRAHADVLRGVGEHPVPLVGERGQLHQDDEIPVAAGDEHHQQRRVHQQREAREAPQRTNPLRVVPREYAAFPLGGEHPVPPLPEAPANLLLHEGVQPGDVEGQDPCQVLPSQRVARQHHLHLVLVMGRVAVMSAVAVAHVHAVLPVQEAGDRVEELVQPARLEHRLV